MSRFWQNFVSNGQQQDSPAYLGIQGYAVRLGPIERGGSTSREGVLVRMVQPLSLAEEAGILEGDIIVSVGEHPVASADELFGILEVLAPGIPAPVMFVRDGRTFERLLVVPGRRRLARKG